jgi:hypothetical protein
MNRYVGLKTTRMLVACIGVATCAAVQAADPLPDSFTLAGVTLYATIDVGYAYQSEGVPLSGKYLGGLEYQASGRQVRAGFRVELHRRALPREPE